MVEPSQEKRDNREMRDIIRQEFPQTLKSGRS